MILPTNNIDDFIHARTCIRGQDLNADLYDQQAFSSDNLFFRHGEAQMFIALKNNIPVGRIAASRDHTTPARGNFGFFECINDVNIASALLNHAEQWLQNRHCDAMHGPLDLSVMRNYRMQISGFNKKAFHTEPRNPSYYPELLRQSGFREHHIWSSWDISPSRFLTWRIFLCFKQKSFRHLTQQGYRIEPMDMQRMPDELARLHPLIMETFANNYGFVPIDFQEYLQIESARPPSDALRVFFIKSPDGSDIGFFAGWLLGRLALLYIIGIKAEHRKKDLIPWMFCDVMKTMSKHGTRSAIGALVREGPSYYNRLGKATRTYAVFSKAIASNV